MSLGKSPGVSTAQTRGEVLGVHPDTGAESCEKGSGVEECKKSRVSFVRSEGKTHLGVLN